MDILHTAGILIIIISAIRGFKKGFVNTIGNILASILSVAFVYCLNTWALEAFLITLLTEHMIIIARVILCIVLYVVLFLLLKAIVVSLRLFTRLPLLKGLNKLLGFLFGGAYGVLLVGIISWIYSWFVQT